MDGGGRPAVDGVPAPGVDVVDRQQPPVDALLLHRAVAATRAHAGRDGLEVAVLVVGDEAIAALHARHLGDPSSTDVLSFGGLDDDHADIVVNAARARREAAQRGTSAAAELALYVVHGLLHCCGHDDHEAAERARMRAAEDAVMRALGLRHAPVDG